MATDPAGFPQPSDETPLVPPMKLPGDPATPAVPPAGPVGVPMPDDPVVRQAINDTAGQLVSGLDLVDETVQGQLAKVRTELVKGTRLVDRVVKAELAQADEDLSTAGRLMTDAGVPISYSPAERAAELDDPQGTALIQRVATAVATDATRPPPDTNPDYGSGCGWRYENGQWLSFGKEGYALPDESTRPWWQAQTDGAVWNTPCVPLNPPTSPPLTPPPPPADPDPAPDAGCIPYVPAYHPGQPELSVWLPRVDHTSPLDRYHVVFTDPVAGGLMDVELPYRPTEWPTVPYRLIVGGYPDPSWRTYPAADLCGAAPSPPPPPTSPPPTSPPASCPPIQPACPAPVIQVMCPPTSPPPPPTSPPVTKPEPVPPTSPPPPSTDPTPDPAHVPQISVVAPSNPTQAIDWDQSFTCVQLDSLGNIAKPIMDREIGKNWWEIWARADAKQQGKFAGVLPSLNRFVGDALTAVASLPEALSGALTTQIMGGAVADLIMVQSTNKRQKNWAQVATLASGLALAVKAEEWSGAPMTYLMQSDLYAMQYLTPQYIPTQAEIDGLYLTKRIADDYWECLTKALGNLPNIHRQVRDAKRTTPGVSEVIALRRRSILSTEDVFVDRMRQLGVTDPAHAKEFYKLSEFLPPFTDLIRMMVRDVEDEGVVQKFGYDKDFDNKYKGKLKRWAADQGIPDEVAQYLWRAHWDTPSNTALYEMLHRLRPDRPEVEAWRAAAAEQGLDPEWIRANPEPLVVSTADAKYLLEVNDMSPKWVTPLLEISYRPITNTDARRAYEIGSMTDDGLYHAFRDNGYSPGNARTLVQFAKADRDRSIGAKTGVTSPRKVLDAFRGGLIDRIQADRLLLPSFPDAEVRRSIVDRGEVERVIDTRRLAVKVLNKRYAYGEINDVQLVNALGGLGINGDEARTIVQRAQANRAGHLKEVRVQYVLDMLVRGIITVDQTADRLEQLGYFAPDIDRMIALAGSIRTEKQAARAAAAANKARIEASRARREALSNLDRLEQQKKDQVSQLEQHLQQLLAQIQAAGGAAPSFAPA